MKSMVPFIRTLPKIRQFKTLSERNLLAKLEALPSSQTLRMKMFSVQRSTLAVKLLIKMFSRKTLELASSCHLFFSSYSSYTWQ